MTENAGRQPGFAALAVCILASALAQVLLKIGVLRAACQPAWDAGPWVQWLASCQTPGLGWIAAGLASYAISLLAWLQVLARLPLSAAYPLLGISYVLVYGAAAALPVLAEELTPMRTVGVLLVACGAGMVSATARPR
jgi:undecaprenyl phosphate-alpha-L-ara4N flippase subunit ArnF